MRLPPSPDLDWTDDALPRARAFEDTYFSRAGGLAESRAVFLAGCGLPEGWAGRARFSIAELGFGTGLNALAAWEAWAHARPPGGVLHFVSVEGFPLDRDQARRALSAFPELGSRAQRLLDRWPVRARGPQRLWFPEDGFALTVIHAPAADALAGLDHRFDAWFLDGFAPARNPDLWSPALMQRVAALSAPGARLATYTVAGEVRRALSAAGFAWEKKPGFAHKRERLEARLNTPPAPRRQSESDAGAAPAVHIIGSGVAGSAVAAAFARRGVRAAILDAGDPNASSAPAALLMPRLDRGDAATGRAFLAAYLAALGAYGDALAPIGVEQRAQDALDAEALADLACDPPLPADLLRAMGEGLFHPRAGVLDPVAACAHLRGQAQVRRARVVALERGEGWTLRLDDGGEARADIVVLAAGPGLGAFAQTRWLPLSYSRGQIDWAPLASPPPHAVAAGAYAAPFKGGLVFGATFDRAGADAAIAPDAGSTARNLAALEKLAPDLAAKIDRARLQARAALRVTTPDRAPVVGQAPDARAWAAHYQGLRHGRAPAGDGPMLSGLYVCGGFGARGFLMAPLMGEEIASHALGEPAVLDADARAALAPGRFILRALRRGRSLDL